MQHKKLSEITVDSLVSQIERVGKEDLQKTSQFFLDSYHLLMDHELFDAKDFRKQFTNSIMCLTELQDFKIHKEDLGEIEESLWFLETSMMILITHELFDSKDFRVQYCNAIGIVQTLTKVPNEPFGHP